MTVLCALLLTLAGSALVYLASTRQRLRATSLPQPIRAIGWLLMLGGLVAWLLASGVGAGIASALTAIMLTWVLLPYLAWWRTAGDGADKP
ncbi:hypothetical protein [Dyella jiangningensis]|uniref:Transmembrane protein n=1 Tax=Dyella jiangningensis TaxID=1379159 RepID=A0A328P435_9GAMM|nr:hypothetical protein [Dyella jiangningensis]RAO76061.1 hypothetical protein CA260_12060 [Dyella jiangningensis]